MFGNLDYLITVNLESRVSGRFKIRAIGTDNWRNEPNASMNLCDGPAYNRKVLPGSPPSKVDNSPVT